MKISFRGWFVIGVILALVVAVGVKTQWLHAETPTLSKGQLSEASLGSVLASLGLQVKQVNGRYDFTFKSVHDNQQWDLSMSAVLSRNGQTIWIMAWLDELPKSAADVPRTALLRLLSHNDQMGNGKFFAYVAGNRRFVLQRVIPNQNVSSDSLRTVLQDLQETVIVTYPQWSVASWKTLQETPVAQALPSIDDSPKPTTGTTVRPTPNRLPLRSVLRDSKFGTTPIRR